MSPWSIRPETAGDEAGIAAVTAAAFAGDPRSDGSEARIVADLRRQGDLALSLVAEREGRIIGHIAFSPVRVSDGTDSWFGLAPVSVAPARQGGGVGMALVARGLDLLRSMGARGCVVLGDPGYYHRFGFAPDPRLIYPGPPAEFFQCLALGGELPQGVVRYAPAFGGDISTARRS